MATATVTISRTATPGPAQTETPTATPHFFEQEKLVLVRGLYPNPFSESLKVYFTLRVAAEVDWAVYTVAGERVEGGRLDGQAGKNVLRWEGVNLAGKAVASGVYLLRVEAVGRDGSRAAYWERAVVAR